MHEDDREVAEACRLLRSGRYLHAGATCYRIVAADDEAITVRIVAGSVRFRGRTIAWSVRLVRAMIAYNSLTVSDIAPPVELTERRSDRRQMAMED